MYVVKAGESHGRAIVGILCNVPAGIKIEEKRILDLLRERRRALGRSSRQKKENDKIEIITGIRNGYTLGNNVAIVIKNKAYAEFEQIMGAFSADVESEQITALRPGHADLGGINRFAHFDARNVMEGASARNTCVDVALGAIAISMLEQLGIKIAVEVRSLDCLNSDKEFSFEENLNNTSPYFSQNKKFISGCKKIIDEAKEMGESLGGMVEVTVSPIKPGCGSYVSEKRIDALIAGLLMQTQAVKGVVFGSNSTCEEGFNSYNGVIVKEENQLKTRSFSGGIDGGMTNGDYIKVKAFIKPIPTTIKGNKSVDIATGEECISAKQRADITAVFAICPVLKAKVALAISEAICERVGGDNISAIINRYNSL